MPQFDTFLMFDSFRKPSSLTDDAVAEFHPELTTLDERKKVRQERERHLLDDLKHWFKLSLTKPSKKSDVTVAIHYAIGRWTPLLRYCDDGVLEIDNNAAERALRAVALGRKNYLFAGSNAGDPQDAYARSIPILRVKLGEFTTNFKMSAT